MNQSQEKLRLSEPVTGKGMLIWTNHRKGYAYLNQSQVRVYAYLNQSQEGTQLTTFWRQYKRKRLENICRQREFVVWTWDSSVNRLNFLHWYTCEHTQLQFHPKIPIALQLSSFNSHAVPETGSCGLFLWWPVVVFRVESAYNECHASHSSYWGKFLQKLNQKRQSVYQKKET